MYSPCCPFALWFIQIFQLLLPETKRQSRQLWLLIAMSAVAPILNWAGSLVTTGPKNSDDRRSVYRCGYSAAVCFSLVRLARLDGRYGPRGDTRHLAGANAEVICNDKKGTILRVNERRLVFYPSYNCHHCGMSRGMSLGWATATLVPLRNFTPAWEHEGKARLRGCRLFGLASKISPPPPWHPR